MEHSQTNSTSTNSTKLKHSISCNPCQKKIDSPEIDDNAFLQTRSSDSLPWIPEEHKKSCLQQELALPQYVAETLKFAHPKKNKPNVRKILNTIFSIVVGFIATKLSKSCFSKGSNKHIYVGLVIFILSYCSNIVFLGSQKKLINSQKMDRK